MTMRQRWLMVLALMGCAATMAGCPAVDTSKMVRLGDPTDVALKRLDAAGATDIASQVGMRGAPPTRFDWYELPDGTCLRMTSSQDPATNRQVVKELVLGEKGKGYGDKFAWQEQEKRDVVHVEARPLPTP